jgi:ABC-type proline/glycine betaine transport system permease subunit
MSPSCGRPWTWAGDAVNLKVRRFDEKRETRGRQRTAGRRGPKWRRQHYRMHRARTRSAGSIATCWSGIPFADWVNAFMNWFVPNMKWFFRALNWLLTWPMDWLRELLNWLPWPATVAAITVAAYVASGWRLALFSFLALMYMVLVGYWSESMNTLALVALSVPLSVLIGLLAGIAAYKWTAADRIVQPLLDLAQTFPTFAYLIPILFLFGFGA